MVRRRLAFGLVGLCACASPARPTTTEPIAVLTPPEPASGPPATERPVAPLDPALRELLTAAHRPPPPPTRADGRSPCHPELPDSPREQSLCICEEVCARTIDVAALRRRASRELPAGEGGILHYPYTDTDGTRITFDRDGRVTRCSHSVTGRPGSALVLECASLDRRAHAHGAAAP